MDPFQALCALDSNQQQQQQFYFQNKWNQQQQHQLQTRNIPQPNFADFRSFNNIHTSVNYPSIGSDPSCTDERSNFNQYSNDQYSNQYSNNNAQISSCKVKQIFKFHKILRGCNNNSTHSPMQTFHQSNSNIDRYSVAKNAPKNSNNEQFYSTGSSSNFTRNSMVGSVANNFGSQNLNRDQKVPHFSFSSLQNDTFQSIKSEIDNDSIDHITDLNVFSPHSMSELDIIDSEDIDKVKSFDGLENYLTNATSALLGDEPTSLLSPLPIKSLSPQSKTTDILSSTAKATDLLSNEENINNVTSSPALINYLRNCQLKSPFEQSSKPSFPISIPNNQNCLSLAPVNNSLQSLATDKTKKTKLPRLSVKSEGDMEEFTSCTNNKPALVKRKSITEEKSSPIKRKRSTSRSSLDSNKKSPLNYQSNDIETNNQKQLPNIIESNEQREKQSNSDNLYYKEKLFYKFRENFRSLISKKTEEGLNITCRKKSEKLFLNLLVDPDVSKWVMDSVKASKEEKDINLENMTKRDITVYDTVPKEEIETYCEESPFVPFVYDKEPMLTKFIQKPSKTLVNILNREISNTN